MTKNIGEIVESLSPNEKRVLPFLDEKNIEKIRKKADIDKPSLIRALEFLNNKGIIKLDIKKKEIVELGHNGVLYLKNSLPERRLLNILGEKQSLDFQEAKKQAKLSDDELKAAIGALKQKAMISVKQGEIILSAKIQDVVKKSLEELFIENLPIEFSRLKPEQAHAFKNLKNRKDIVEIKRESMLKLEITQLGRKIMKVDLGKTGDMIEALTPEIINKEGWKGKKFRRYDIKSSVPKISGGKKHFVNQAIEYAKKIWLEMGFKEMTGDLTTSGFWNFDALFTAQDHPVREMQDTFFIKDAEAKIPKSGKKERDIVSQVKKAHEGGIDNSKGWQSEWGEKDAKKVLLRTHTTCLSARTLKKIAENNEFPAKYFALGKCFRNETVDWSHGFEFNQTEGIVVDENANFRQLLGYLVAFFKKMGYEKIRIRPGYFPYTEPSLEIDVFHPVKKKWLELGGAGMFRPEVTIPMFGRHVPVLAWGPGFDRIIMDFFKIHDLRDMYKNNITKLRETKFWLK